MGCAQTDHLNFLRDLLPNWDTYGAEAITENAIKTASYVEYVPVCTGGVQIELHAGGAEIEIEIGPDGRVVGVCWEAKTNAA